MKIPAFILAVLSATAVSAQTQPPLERGLTNHFISWLNDTGNYEAWGFNRTDFFGGSYGGKEDDSTPIKHRPIIFIHGNTDQAIGVDWYSNGFRISIEYFLSRGYTKAELYASMYGFCDYEHGMQHTLNRLDTMRVRNFIEAVLEYTGAEQVDVISHSMGVTYTRRSIKGGHTIADEEPFFIGEPLTDRVNTFIGIAGRNWGIPKCNMDLYENNFHLCNKLNGGYPGS